MNPLQNEDSFPAGFVLGTAQQRALPNFVTTPANTFTEPISTLATAPVLPDSWLFWDDANINRIDYGFSVGNSAMFLAHGHRHMIPYDWGWANETFHGTGIMSQQPLQIEDSSVPPRKDQLLAPKYTSVPRLWGADPQDTAVPGDSLIRSWDGLSGMMNSGEGVDPELLFRTPESSNTAPADANPTTQNSARPIQPMPRTTPVPIAPKPPHQAAISRIDGIGNTKSLNRAKRTASSPIRPSARPGKNRGRGAALLALTPAARPLPKQSFGSRPSLQSSRKSGRMSPFKSHHRLSSLNSIPGSVSYKMIKGSIEFTGDQHSRTRAEAAILSVRNNRDPTPPEAITTTADNRPASRGQDTSGEAEALEDGDFIFIPSRNFSDPQKPTSAHPFQSSRRNVSQQVLKNSLGIYCNEPSASVVDDGSDEETEVDERQRSHGDAVSELRKVVRDRRKRMSLNRNQLWATRPQISASTASPTFLTGASVPASTHHANTVRCVCRRIESPYNSDGFWIQCEACEYWLHGGCTNTAYDNIPKVYICAFCGETPAAYSISKTSGKREIDI